jgi:hypothetical protein
MESRIASLNGETTPESGVFADFYSESLMKSLGDNKVLYDTLAGKTTQVVFPTSGLGRQLSMVAKMIDSRAVRLTDADVFFVETGGCKFLLPLFTRSLVIDDKVSQLLRDRNALLRGHA